MRLMRRPPPTTHLTPTLSAVVLAIANVAVAYAVAKGLFRRGGPRKVRLSLIRSIITVA